MTPEQLRAARQRLGLTQEELAERLGVHVMSVSKWERGQHPIPEPVALAMQTIKRKGGKPPKRK